MKSIKKLVLLVLIPLCWSTVQQAQYFGQIQSLGQLQEGKLKVWQTMMDFKKKLGKIESLKQEKNSIEAQLDTNPDDLVLQRKFIWINYLLEDVKQ